jgi:hypothetical protein
MRAWTRRALTAGAITPLLGISLSAGVPTTAMAQVARPTAATFNGFGLVKVNTPDGVDPYIDVTSYNPATGIRDDECSAVVVVGVAAPEVARCSFRLHQTFDPTAACEGSFTADGYFNVFLPSGTQQFKFTDMQVVVDEGTAHGIGTQYVDMGTGQISTGYAQFDFAGPCNVKNKNFGRVLY